MRMTEIMSRTERTHSVAAEVRAWLARRSRSARSAAQELGWSEVYISRRLRGKVPFDVADLEALAELLDVRVTAFFEPPEWVAPASKSGNRSFRTSRFDATGRRVLRVAA